MKKSKIIRFLKAHKLEILYLLAVIIGTIAVCKSLETIYNTYFTDIVSVTIQISR